MTAPDQRQALNQLAEESGWQHRQHDRVDVFQRGPRHVHVVWRGSAAISGGSRYDDQVLASYTRELGKIRTWLEA